MKTSICIATLNEGPDLQATIALAYASKYQPYEVIVCDDGSDELPDLRQWYDKPNFKLLLNHNRLGSGPAKQKAIEAATGDLIFILDSHIRMKWTAVSHVITAAQENPNSMFCMRSLPFDDGAFDGRGAVLNGEPLPRGKWCPHDEKPDCLMGGCYAFPRAVLEKLGGYAPSLKGWGYEEEWLALRAKKLGVDVTCVTNAVTEHQYQFQAKRPFRAHGSNDWELAYNAHAAAIMYHGPVYWEANLKENITPALSKELTAEYPRLIAFHEWLNNATVTV